jgi:hypothetical protein
VLDFSLTALLNFTAKITSVNNHGTICFLATDYSALPPVKQVCGRRLRVALATQEHVYCFVWDLTTLCGKSIRELRPNGFLVLRPAAEIGDRLVTDVESEVAGEYSEAI